MNKEETTALQLLTGKTKLEEVSVEELEQLASHYPYFSAVQLLLCKKMQQVAHPSLQQQLYKTALHFPNEMWLRYLLLEEDAETNNNVDFKKEIAENNIENQLIESDNERAKETEHKSDEIYEVDNEQKLNTEDNITKESATEIAQKQTETATVTEDENVMTLPVENVLQKLPSTFSVQAEPEEAPMDDEEIQQQTEPLPIEESNQKIASILSGQAQEFHKPVDETVAIKIDTEPLHAVDYFASQGIQLDERKEDNSFDKKVHKFTDWLRQMKRINPQPVDLGTDSEQESYVANIAASSNQSKDIITESMAEVLLKQNKREKAVEIYEKLSLLYPLKNAYFAAKIQHIKY